MFIFFFNDTATTEIYTLSLHDALPISYSRLSGNALHCAGTMALRPLSSEPPTTLTMPWASRRMKSVMSTRTVPSGSRAVIRSEEHTSELQSRQYLVCRLLLEKKKKQTT